MKFRSTWRLSLLASCLAFPAMAQQMPAPVPALPSMIPAAQAAPGTPQMTQEQADEMQRKLQAEAQRQAQADADKKDPAADVPRRDPPPVKLTAPDPTLTKKEATGMKTARIWINRPTRILPGPDGVVHFTSEQGQPQIVASVYHFTNISLAPGEVINPPIFIGDPDFWKVHTTMYGSGRHMVSSIVVKPSDAGLHSNLIVPTNKRLLNISLTSTGNDYMPMVALDIPADDAMGINASVIANNMASPCDQVPTIPPNQFKVDGPRVAWLPTQVFIVATAAGDKTCIGMPANIISGDMPLVFELADDGGWFHSPTKKILQIDYYKRNIIVSGSPDHLVLVSGVGGDQRLVSIDRRKQ